MINLIGDDVVDWFVLMVEFGVYVYFYGKGEVCLGCKMGYVMWLW